MISLACCDNPHLATGWGETMPLPDIPLVAAPFLTVRGSLRPKRTPGAE
jgi:hypothetical protein